MIDCHQHLMMPDMFYYPWTRSLAQLQGRFGLDDYRIISDSCNIHGTIFVEGDVEENESHEEAHYFCKLAENPESGILGVIASGRPEYEGFSDYLDCIAHPALKGIRRVLHGVPDTVSQTAVFRNNIAALAERNLTFDLCFRADQLALARSLIAHCPDTRFILDHAGQPPLKRSPDAMEQWRADLAELSLYQNLHVKLSGLLTCLPKGIEPLVSLQPVINHLITCFGSQRILWGSDWPVCNLASDYRSWFGITVALLATLSEEDRELIFSKNACNLYRLTV